MSIEKQREVKTNNKLLDHRCEIELISEQHFIHQVQLRLKDVEDGRIYTHNQVKDMVMQWRKSSIRI